MLTHLINGLDALGNGPAIAYLFGGALLGMFLGVIPGLGGAVVLSIILAFVYHISDTGTLCLFLATQAGSYFSASITSILLNTPAHPEAFAVTFDGFPMAQKGEAGRALGISASSTMIGGLIGCGVLIGFLQILDQLPDLFHPPEYVALISIALLLVGTLGTDAIAKAFVSAGIGLILSCVGVDPISGTYRYTFNAVGLYNGVSLVALFLGLFAIPQMVLIFGTGTTIARQDMMGNDVKSQNAVVLDRGFGRQVIQGVGDTMHHWVALVRAALIGVLTGIIPGIGGFAANFLSYGIAQQFSKKRSEFGTGIPEGIIAPEGSSLAKEAGGMVPLLGLGIPGGVGGALFLAALTIHSVRAGYGFTTSYPVLAYETVWVIVFGGIIGTMAGLLAAPQLAKVTRVPGPLLVPFIMAVSIIGAYAADVQYFDILEVGLFAMIGFALRRLRYSLAVFGIALILGPDLEQNIYETHEIYPGLHFLSRPFADTLFAIGIGILTLKAVQLHREHKKANAPIEEEDVLLRAEAIRRRENQRRPFPLLAMITTVTIFCASIPFLIYTATAYMFNTGLLPMIAGSLVSAGTLWRLPTDVGHYISYRRDRAASRSTQVTPEEPAPTFEPAGVGAVPAGAGDGTFQSSAADLVEAMGPAPTEFARQSARSGIKDKTWGRFGQYTREVVAFLWFGSLLALIWLFGFEIGIAVFCAGYGLLGTGYVLRTPLRRVIYATISAAVMSSTAYEVLNLLHNTFTAAIRF